MSRYLNARMPDGSRVVLLERGTEGPDVVTYEVVELRREGDSGLVRVGTMVGRQRHTWAFFLV